MKKGSLGYWLILLAFGWITTILWIIFTTITVEHFYPWALTQINNTNSTAVLQHTVNYWNYWPLLLMFGLTLAAIIASTKREPGDAYVSV